MNWNIIALSSFTYNLHDKVTLSLGEKEKSESGLSCYGRREEGEIEGGGKEGGGGGERERENTLLSQS